MSRERGWQEYWDGVFVDLLGEQENVFDARLVEEGDRLRWGSEGGAAMGYRGLPLEGYNDATDGD